MEKIKLSIDTKKQALEVYLPYVSQGAVLIDSSKNLNLNDCIDLTISFPELRKEMACESKVVWLSAKDIHNNIKFGVQLCGEDGLIINQTLQNYLAGKLNDE